MTDATGTIITKTFNVPQLEGSMSHPIILPVVPLPEYSKFSLEVSAKAEATVDGTVLLSPIELIVDQPLNLGCFQMETGLHATEKTSPQTCLLHCNSLQMRFALITQGNKCSCVKSINHDVFTELTNSQCLTKCQDDLEYYCGGESAVSLYVAGKGACQKKNLHS